MGLDNWSTNMTGGSLYSNDPYLSILNNHDSLLFSTSATKPKPKSYANGKLGGGDPLAFAPRDGDPLAFAPRDGEEDVKRGGDRDGTTEDETEDTESDVEDWPSAPPVDYLERVQGYEMVSFDTVSVPPPAAPPPEETDGEKKEGSEGGGGGNNDGPQQPADAAGTGTGPANPPAVIAPPTIPSLSQAEARAALLKHISHKCCYGSGAAKQMRIASMDYVPACHYELQTFTEKRETSWTYAPHKGGEVDSPARGPAPLPWDIEEKPLHMFKDEVRVVTVPRTGVVKACHKCRGTGGMTCRDCSGKGWVRCLHCHGDVYLSDGGGSLGRDRCYYCQHSKHGHGQQDCSKCQAKGKVSCATCEGSAHIRCYIQLSITWRVNTAEHIVEKLNMPEDLIREVSGQVAFEEEKDKVFPVDAFNDEVIKMASSQLVTSHAANFLDQKILRQRHQVRIVPVTKVMYEWKGKTRPFFVYGYENKVHLPPSTYPQSCCWGCNLM